MKKYGFLKLIIYFLIILIASYIMSCRYNSSKPTKVTLGALKSLNTTLFHVAQSKGYFREAGLDASIVPYTSSGEALDDMLENATVDFVISSETPVLYQCFKRDDFKILSVVYEARNDPKIIARKDLGIKFVPDLIDKNIGTTKKGQSAHYFLELYLTRYLIDKEKINISHHPPAELVRMLKNAELDAISIFEPLASQTAESLGNNALVLEVPGLYLKFSLLTSKTSFIEKNPELTKNFINALNRAYEYYLKNEQKALDYSREALEITRLNINTSSKAVFFLKKYHLSPLQSELNWISRNNPDLELKQKLKYYFYTDPLLNSNPKSVDNNFLME